MLLLRVNLVLVLVVGLLSTVNGLSKLLQRCKAGDTTCLASTMTAYLQTYPGGIPELGIASIDPWFVGNVSMTQDGDGPVSAQLKLIDCTIRGWSKATVTKVVGFEKDPRKSKFEIHVNVPVDTTTGRYSINGKILLIPIFGTGLATVHLNGMDMVFRFKTQVETRNGEDYLKIKKLHTDTSIKSLNSNLENLFNDPVLSKNINQLMNDNGVLLFNETRIIFGVERSKITKALIAPLFDRFPYRMLFADDE